MPRLLKSGRVATWLAWTLTGVALLGVAVPAHAIDVDEWVGVIGVSADGQRYALCRALGWDEDTLREECANFRAPAKESDDDPGIIRRNIYVCRTVSEPPATDDAIQRLCDKRWRLKNDSASLEKIKSELKAAGIRLRESVRYLDVRSNGFQIPMQVVGQFGMSAPIDVSWDYLDSAWRLRFHAKGYGAVSIRQGRGDHGVWDYELTTVTLASGTPWLFYNVGTVMEETRYRLPWAIRLDRVAARLLNSRGFRKHKRGDFVGSARDFERAFAADPSYAQAAFNAACAEARIGNADAALEHLQQAISLKPSIFKQKAREDSDLDAIRGEKKFSALMQ